jgi:hypothetical protein
MKRRVFVVYFPLVFLHVDVLYKRKKRAARAARERAKQRRGLVEVR